jgi:hypothetical protein
MNLWTWQGSDFSISSDKCDPLLSRQRHSVEGLAPYYDRLYSLLGSDQWIWCSTWDAPWYSNTDPRVRVQLKVLEPGKLKFVSCCAWSLIRGLQPEVPRPVSKLAHREAVACGVDPESHIRQVERAWLTRYVPNGDPWTSILTVKPMEHSVEVLVPVPVPREWIVTLGR